MTSLPGFYAALRTMALCAWLGAVLTHAPAAFGTVSLSSEVQAIKQEAEAAFRSKDMAQVRAVFHAKFRTDGRDLEQQIAYLSIWAPAFANWGLLIHDVTEVGELLRLNG